MATDSSIRQIVRSIELDLEAGHVDWPTTIEHANRLVGYLGGKAEKRPAGEVITELEQSLRDASSEIKGLAGELKRALEAMPSVKKEADEVLEELIYASHCDPINRKRVREQAELLLSALRTRAALHEHNVQDDEYKVLLEALDRTDINKLDERLEHGYFWGMYALGYSAVPASYQPAARDEQEYPNEDELDEEVIEAEEEKWPTNADWEAFAVRRQAAFRRVSVRLTNNGVRGSRALLCEMLVELAKFYKKEGVHMVRTHQALSGDDLK